MQTHFLVTRRSLFRFLYDDIRVLIRSLFSSNARHKLRYAFKPSPASRARSNGTFHRTENITLPAEFNPTLPPPCSSGSTSHAICHFPWPRNSHQPSTIMSSMETLSSKDMYLIQGGSAPALPDPPFPVSSNEIRDIMHISRIWRCMHFSPVTRASRNDSFSPSLNLSNSHEHLGRSRSSKRPRRIGRHRINPRGLAIGATLNIIDNWDSFKAGLMGYPDPASKKFRPLKLPMKTFPQSLSEMPECEQQSLAGR